MQDLPLEVFERGRIINNGSVSAQTPRPHMTAYTVSKHANRHSRTSRPAPMVRQEMFRLRRAAARRQKLRCHYCDVQMWLTDSTPFLALFGLSAEQAARFQCTAEHLVPRRDGGPNSKANVVVACRFCNIQRHDDDAAPALDHLAYRAMVRERMAQGSWHPQWALEKGIVGSGRDAIRTPALRGGDP